MNEKEFVGGLYVNVPKESRPDFVVAEGAIRRKQMLDFLNGKTDEWINFEVTRPKNPNPEKPRRLNAFVDTWEPKQQPNLSSKKGATEDFDDDIPF